MDKYEYKISVEEIKRLIKEGNYAEAVEIADTIDWRRVKSVMMLCTISDLYKINRRYEDARDVLLLAYEHRPGGRTICYSLCELCLKTGQILPAMEYFKEFVQIAPNDPGRLILQYKIYQAQGASLEEKIKILEELKKKDYRERWAYELATLYHTNGDISKCVSECDELILWFGEGKYVVKAMELKMQHQPLSQEQQYHYDHRFEEPGAAQSANEAEKALADKINADEALVKTVDVSQYNTMNLQEELAAGLKEVLDKNAAQKAAAQQEEAPTQEPAETAEAPAQEPQKAPVEEMQEAPAAQEPVVRPTTKEMPVLGYEPARMTDSDTKVWGRDEITRKLEEMKATSERAAREVSEESRNNPEVNALEVMQEELAAFKQSARENMVVDAMQKDVMLSQPPRQMANVLSQESDGQISMVMPETEKVEKQITGQISIDDVLAEWEEKKRRSRQMHEEEIRKRVQRDTGEMFTEFEQAVKDGLLEKLESGEIQLSDVEIESPAEELVEEPVSEEIAEQAEAVEEGPAEAVEEEPAEQTEEEPAEAVEEEPAEQTEEEPAEAVEEEPAEQTEEEPAEAVEEEPAEQMEEEPAEAVEEPVEQAEEEPGDILLEEGDKEDDKGHSFTEEEKELFAPFIQSKNSKEQLAAVLDKISIASYTGNVIITGVAGHDTLALAKCLIKDMQAVDNNFTGESAKITGENLNTKNVAEIVDKLKNGALIIEKVSTLSDVTVNKLYQCLMKEETGIIVFMIDTLKKMNIFLEEHSQLETLFNCRMNLEVLSNDALANFGKRYANQREYAVDDNMGMLALHTRIEDMQSGDHAVTVLEVKAIVDEAIERVNRKTVGHFFDVLFGRRYDDEDMIILGEKDFVKKK